MNAKTPVSALQELMAARQHPLPIYVEEGFGTSFKCTVHVEGISAVGYGTNKKTAKHDSAKNALTKLQSPDLQKVHVQLSPIVSKPFKNYVGELNEYSSQRGLSYPDYQFVTATVSGQFIFSCTFLGNKVQGVGVNKKDAKQDAAKNMLELVASGKSVSNESQYKTVQQKYVPELEDTNLVIEMFNKLSTDRREFRESKIIRVESDPDIAIDDEEDSVEELEKKLKKYKIEYVVKDFQMHPYVVSLVIKDTNFTFLATGDCKRNALKQVYKDVLALKKSGCSLNADLTSFN